MFSRSKTERASAEMRVIWIFISIGVIVIVAVLVSRAPKRPEEPETVRNESIESLETKRQEKAVSVRPQKKYVLPAERQSKRKPARDVIGDWLDNVLLAGPMYLRWRIQTDRGPQLVVTVSDEWYYKDDYLKERAVRAIGELYRQKAVECRLADDSPGDRPSVLFVDQFGEELAYHSRRLTKVYR